MSGAKAAGATGSTYGAYSVADNPMTIIDKVPVEYVSVFDQLYFGVSGDDWVRIFGVVALVLSAAYTALLIKNQLMPRPANGS